MSTGFVDSELFERHVTTDLPERPMRVRAIREHLAQVGLLARLTPIEPYPAPRDMLLLAHDEAYLERLEAACLEMGDREGCEFDEDDVKICRHTWDTAVLAAGGALALCDAVMEGRLTNGFANIRPPGHHAERDRAMGFCLLASAVIAARYLQTRWHLKKIAIVDWDVHHGNGTQHILEADPTILVINLHEHPTYCYPGTGYADETGTGPGEGFTLNIPMLPETGDAEYQAAFLQKVIPALDAFAPEAIIISAGFDAHRDDPLAEIELSTKMYAWMTRRIKEVAKRHCRDRIISLLEGGYNLKALAESVRAHVEVLAEPLPEEEHLNWKSGMH